MSTTTDNHEKARVVSLGLYQTDIKNASTQAQIDTAHRAHALRLVQACKDYGVANGSMTYAISVGAKEPAGGWGPNS